MKVVQFNDKLRVKQWLINVKNELKTNYKQMFNPNSKMYNELWEQYVEIEYRLTEEGFKPIGIPDEMEFPLFEQYLLDDLKENYTKWYKENYNIFCKQMLDVITQMEDYINKI